MNQSNLSKNYTPARKKRIVIANGFAYDKRFLFEVLKRMSTDFDLRRLSGIGSSLLIWVTLVSIIGTIYTLPDFQQIFKQSLLSFSQICIILTAVWLLIQALITYCKDIKSNKPSGKFKNLSYWFPFSSHPSDRDPLILLGNCIRDNNTRISGVYIDGPYYDTYFVDSIYLRFESEKSQNKSKIPLYIHIRQKHLERIFLWAIPAIFITLLLIAYHLQQPFFGKILTMLQQYWYIDIPLIILFFINWIYFIRFKSVTCQNKPQILLKIREKHWEWLFFPVIPALFLILFVISFLIQKPLLSEIRTMFLQYWYLHSPLILLFFGDLFYFTVDEVLHFNRRYYKNSAEYADYDSFTDSKKHPKETGPFWSLNGYGFLYLSRFIHDIMPDFRNYEVNTESEDIAKETVQKENTKEAEERKKIEKLFEEFKKG